MKKKLILILIPFAALLILSSSQLSDNGKAGKTGSPGELTCHDCHSSYTVNTGGGSITIQSPNTPGFQYTPGQTYSMSVTVAKTGVGLFGVGIEALTSSNTNAGTLNITDAASTQIKSATVSGVSRRNVVHTFNGGASNDSKIFNFSWTAPAAGTGSVTFYFAGVAANSSGSENGDYVYNSSQVFTEANCNPPSQPVSVSGNNSICNGSSNTYSVAAVAGATSYTWTLPGGWTGTSTTSSIIATAGSSSGNITVTANNACGASPQASFAVTVDNLSATTTKTNVSCFGGSNGTATAIPAGGTGGYTYLWSPSGGSGATATNLSSGTYTVTVTDQSGCTRTASATITQPAAISVTTTPSNPACANQNGSIVAAPSGGTGPYTYSWSPSGGTTATANVPAGTYTVTVTDANGCTKTASSTLTAPTAVTVTVTPTAAACANANGSATAVPAGGTGPYTYQWSPSGGTSATATVPAGNYIVHVTDSRGCTASQSATITQPAALTVSCTSTAATCAAANGSATALPGGGTAPYSYSWSTVPVQTAATATNLTGGNYSVTVSDAHGCTTTSSVQVSQPSTLNATASATAVSCNGGNNGIAVVTATGGSPAYSYVWNTIPPQNNDTATGLAAGTYSVTVTDSAGCAFAANVTVSEPLALTVSAGADVSVCEGASIALQAVASGGTAAYSFMWSPSAGLSSDTIANPVASPSAATAFTLTVTDAHGCTSSSSVNISVSANPVAVITVSGDTLYSTVSDTYSWLLNGIPVGAAGYNYFVPQVNGDYSVVLTNADGCSDTSAIYPVNTVGIIESSADNQINIYPNPATDFLIINSTLKELNANITLLDLCGRSIASQQLQRGNNRIDLNAVSKGIYFVMITNGDKSIFKTLMKN